MSSLYNDIEKLEFKHPTYDFKLKESIRKSIIEKEKWQKIS
jgi:hypothetical protein